MNTKKVKDAIVQLYDAGKKVYLACTGAGAGVTNMLWQVPCASSTLVGSSFPYAQGEFNAFVGKDWKQSGYSYCGCEAAVALAQAAYLRCQEVCVQVGDFSPVIGLGLTAAVTTSRHLRGGTRCFGAVRTYDGIHTCEVWMEQGFLGRSGDGEVCDLIALNLVLFASGGTEIPFSKNQHLFSENFVEVEEGLVLVPKKLPASDVSLETGPVFLDAHGAVTTLSEHDFSGTVLFPGSFNPLQFGHDAIAHAVELATGKRVIFEITTQNADKITEHGEVLHRAQQFVHRWPVILRTGASLFVEKATEYRGGAFVVGADTALRILDPEYYGDAGGLMTVLRRLADLGTKFYVLRRSVEGQVMSHDDLVLPLEYKEMFIPLPGRWDISSTEIRRAHGSI